jgi:hypothetical protein
MIAACSGGSGGGATGRNAAGFGFGDALAFAASPTFGLMALLTIVLPNGSPAEMLCSAGHLLPLDGMAVMYLLMSAFHLAPWLKLISQWRRRR